MCRYTRNPTDKVCDGTRGTSEHVHARGPTDKVKRAERVSMCIQGNRPRPPRQPNAPTPPHRILYAQDRIYAASCALHGGLQNVKRSVMCKRSRSALHRSLRAQRFTIQLPQLGKVSQAKQQRSKHRSRTKLIPAKRCIARCKSRSTLAGNLPDEPKDAILASRGARFNSASLVGGPSSSIAASASCCSSLQLHAFHMKAFEQCVQASKDTSRTMGRHTVQVQTKL